MLRRQPVCGHRHPPNSSVVLCAPQGWPALDPAAVATIAKAEIAATLVAAIETATPEQHGGILIGVAALLGHDGVAAQIDDAKGIVAAGGSPLTVALLEQRPGNVTTLVLTVPALAPQRRMLH